MEVKANHLEDVVLQIGEAVLATAETVDQLANEVRTLSSQIQQQGYQMFALSNAVQTLAENQDITLERLRQLTETLQDLIVAIETPEG